MRERPSKNWCKGIEINCFMTGHRFRIIFLTRGRGMFVKSETTSKEMAKATNLLNDKKTYKVLKKDPTTSYQNKFNGLIKSWLQKDYITTTTAQKLYCETGTISKFYVLPKIHKQDIPVRPIISACTSLSYQLSKFYHRILSNVTGMKRSFVKNSEEFVKKVKKHIIPVGHTLISLDRV